MINTHTIQFYEGSYVDKFTARGKTKWQTSLLRSRAVLLFRFDYLEFPAYATFFSPWAVFISLFLAEDSFFLAQHCVVKSLVLLQFKPFE